MICCMFPKVLHTQVFHNIIHMPDLLKDDRFRLTIIGHGSLKVPDELTSKVTVKSNLEYKVCFVAPKSRWGTAI